MFDNCSPLMKRLAEIMPKKPEPPQNELGMLRFEEHPIRQAADLFSAWMNDDLPANKEEIRAMLWVFGEILNGEMERRLNYMHHLQDDYCGTFIKPQMIHLSEVGEVTEEQMKAMADAPPNPTLKFYHCSTETSAHRSINGMDEYMRDGEDPEVKEHRMDCPKYAPRPFLPYYTDAQWQKHYDSLKCSCIFSTEKEKS